jgi:hypothetical protein
MKTLILTLLGKNLHRPGNKDVLDILFEHPEMTLKQADWLVNGRRRLFTRLAFLLLVLAAAMRWWFS